PQHAPRRQQSGLLADDGGAGDQRADGLHARHAADRDDDLRKGVERADTDRVRVRVRTGDASSSSAAICAAAPLRCGPWPGLRARSHRRLSTAREFRNLPEHALDQHQLTAVVHLVFLRPEQHLEARLARRLHRGRERDGGRERRFVETLEKPGERLAVLGQRADDVGFRAQHLLRLRRPLHARGEVREVEVFDLVRVRLDLPHRTDGEVGEQLADAHHVWRGLVAVPLFGNLVGDRQGILPDGAETVGEVLGSVIRHPRSLSSMLEWVAAGFTLANVFLATRHNIWSWPVGVVAVSLYLYVFAEAKLYSDAGLQVFFLVMQFYGWYQWTRGGVEHAKSLSPVTRLSRRGWLLTL